MTADRVRWVRCGTCGTEWPTPWHEAPEGGVTVDYTCPICLHALIALYQRTVAELEGHLAGAITTMQDANQTILLLVAALRAVGGGVHAEFDSASDDDEEVRH